MKHTASLLAALAIAFISSSASADTHLWVTTEGSGIEITTDGHLPGPPPPPPLFGDGHHHHHHHGGYCKVCKKHYKKMMKHAEKQHKKARKAHHHNPGKSPGKKH